MSRLYGTLMGGGKNVTKAGTIHLAATINGWSTGIACGASVELKDGKPTDGERFYAQITGGTNGDKHINAEMHLTAEGDVHFYHNGNLVYTTKGK